MMLMDDDKKKAATIVVGIAEAQKPENEYGELKKEAAQAVIDAIKEDKAEDLMEALSAFVMLCEEADD